MVLHKLPFLLFSHFHPLCDDFHSPYTHRWNLELHFHQIKTLLAIDVLCCKSADLIKQELAVGLISSVCSGNAALSLPLLIWSVSASKVSSIPYATSLKSSMQLLFAPKKQEALISEMLSIIASDPLPLRPD